MLGHASTARSVRTANPLQPCSQGEAVHAYLGHLSDAAIEAMLNELATELSAQERIYVAFADRTSILDAGEDHG